MIALAPFAGSGAGTFALRAAALLRFSGADKEHRKTEYKKYGLADESPHNQSLHCAPRLHISSFSKKPKKCNIEYY
jgi:hypothetical protein